MSHRDGLQLVHDVQDVCLMDRDGNRVGRVDSLVLVPRSDGRLRVATILIGGPVRARRVGWIMVSLHNIMCRIFRIDRAAGESKVPFSNVRTIGETIEIDVDGKSLPSGHLERWLNAHVIGHIPGSSGDTK